MNESLLFSAFMYAIKMWNDNRNTSRFEAHLVYKHIQKPDFLISNAR